MSMYVKVNGVWREKQGGDTKQNDAWSKNRVVSAKDGDGVWKEVFNYCTCQCRGACTCVSRTTCSCNGRTANVREATGKSTSCSGNNSCECLSREHCDCVNRCIGKGPCPCNGIGRCQTHCDCMHRVCDCQSRTTCTCDLKCTCETRESVCSDRTGCSCDFKSNCNCNNRG